MDKEDIDQLKRDLRSYKWHKREANRIMDQLVSIQIGLIGVSSPRSDGVPGGGTPNDGKSDSYYNMLQKRDKLSRAYYTEKQFIARLDDMLSTLEEEYRLPVIDRFINKKEMQSIARKYHLSYEGAKYRTEVGIKKMLRLPIGG